MRAYLRFLFITLTLATIAAFFIYMGLAIIAASLGIPEDLYLGYAFITIAPLMLFGVLACACEEPMPPRVHRPLPPLMVPPPTTTPRPY